MSGTGDPEATDTGMQASKGAQGHRAPGELPLEPWQIWVMEALADEEDPLPPLISETYGSTDRYPKGYSGNKPHGQDDGDGDGER